MKDNIVIEKVWQDNDFFEVNITCTSELITATSQVYLNDVSIDDLSNKIRDFLDGRIKDCRWQSGEEGDKTTPCVALDFSFIDSLGHVQIEIFMEINDGGMLSKHNCCFFVKTEYGLLVNFKNDLRIIKEKHIGVRAVLNKEL